MVVLHSKKGGAKMRFEQDKKSDSVSSWKVAVSVLLNVVLFGWFFYADFFV